MFTYLFDLIDREPLSTALLPSLQQLQNSDRPELALGLPPGWQKPVTMPFRACDKQEVEVRSRSQI